MDLIAGANIIVPTTKLILEIQISGIPSTELDFSAYSLTEQHKVRGDNDMIFYGQLQNADSSIQLEQRGNILFHLNLPQIHPQIQRIAICATLANEQFNFSRLSALNIKVKNQQQIIAKTEIMGKNHLEVALILGEFYRHKGQWKFKAIAQGFNGGLKPLAEYFGVEISDESSTTVQPQPSPSSNTGNTIKDILSAPLKFLEKNKNLKEFKQIIQSVLAKSRLLDQDQQLLSQFCQQKNLPLQEALQSSQLEVKNFLFKISQYESKQNLQTWAYFLQAPSTIVQQATLIMQQANEEKFVQMVKAALSDGYLSVCEIEQLNQFSQSHQLNQKQLMQRAQNSIANFFNFTLASLISDGTISHENELLIQKLCNFLHPEPQLLQQIKYTVKIAKQIDQIKKGQVDTLQTTEIIVKNSEFVYLHQKRVGIQATKKEYITGDLFITSERIIFKASTAFELLISNIIAVEIFSEYIAIIAKTKKGSGKYHIGKDANIVEAYIEYTIKRFHRQLDFQQSAGNTRYIPQNIKTAVWQKCQGKCVQCSSVSYLEFDHIIPFSKGGSNSENNLQILCRKCNLEKSNQI